MLHRSPYVASSDRAAAVTHLLRLLDPEPTRRTGISASAWAHELADLVAPPVETIRPVPPRRRKHAIRAAVLAAALSAALLPAVFRTPQPPAAVDDCPDRPMAVAPDTSATASAAPASPNSWPSRPLADMPPFAAGCGPVLYEQSFAQPSSQWPAASTDAYTTKWGDAAYQLHVPGRGVFEPVPSPVTVSAGDEVVSATATVTSGQGAWGIWCRGTDPQGSRRYEFVMSHAGAVQIVEPDNQYATGWVYVVGLDMTKPVTLSARCADVVGSLVQLTLAVNGHIAFVYRPKTILGPGYAGIEGMTFSDVEGPTITAAYRRFGIRRPA